MYEIAFVAVRKNGKNFGKPVTLDSVMKNSSLQEVIELDQSDGIRFYDSNGDAIASIDAIASLEDYEEFKILEQCKSKEDFEAFIAANSDSKYISKAKEHIEEIIFKSAVSDKDLKTFLMRFPNSKFVDAARQKLPEGYRHKILVVSSLDRIDVNDSLIEALEAQDHANLTSSILDKNEISSLEMKVRENDIVLAVMDDNHYVELFMLFALNLKHGKKVIPIYPHDKPLKKISNGELANALIKAQSSTINPVFQEVARDIRIDLDNYLKRIKEFTSLKTDQIDQLKGMI